MCRASSWTINSIWELGVRTKNTGAEFDTATILAIVDGAQTHFWAVDLRRAKRFRRSVYLANQSVAIGRNRSAAVVTATPPIDFDA